MLLKIICLFMQNFNYDCQGAKLLTLYINMCLYICMCVWIHKYICKVQSIFVVCILLFKEKAVQQMSDEIKHRLFMLYIFTQTKMNVLGNFTDKWIAGKFLHVLEFFVGVLSLIQKAKKEFCHIIPNTTYVTFWV